MEGATTAPRIPAWKRIGLKLKYAKDTADENTPTVSKPSPNHQESKKSTKRPADDGGEPETPAKRVKPSKSENTSNGRKEDSKPGPAATKTPKRIVFDEEGKNGRPSALRKSVSFTPDTKVEDGFSASNFFKAWVNGGENSTSEEKEQPEESKSPSKDPSEPKNDEKKKKPKKPKKSKSTLMSSEEESTSTQVTKASKNKKESKPSKKPPKTEETPSYLLYLTSFHTSRTTWKFHKTHQNALLKNLFNIYRIPPSHNPAINAYIAGLQGSARGRVAREAVEILKGIGGGEEASSLEACSEALRRKEGEDAEDEEEKRRIVERGRRAEGILREALGEEEVEELFATGGEETAEVKSITASTAAAATEKASQPEDKKPQRRKRKARTDVSSSSSSSESSSSESESESESDSDSD